MKEVDFFSPGARLALELECLLLSCEDTAAVSKWWDSAHEALEQWRQAVRDMEAAIDAAQPEASTALEQADDHAHICFKLAEQYKSDPVLFAALTDAAAIIRDMMYGDLIETLRDCANALDELLPRDHAYRKIVEQANRLLDRHDQASNEQRAASARKHDAALAEQA